MLLLHLIVLIYLEFAFSAEERKSVQNVEIHETSDRPLTLKECFRTRLKMDDDNYRNVINWYKSCIKLGETKSGHPKDAYTMRLIQNLIRSSTEFFSQTKLTQETMNKVENECSEMVDKILYPSDMLQKFENGSGIISASRASLAEKPICGSRNGSLEKSLKQIKWAAVVASALIFLILIILFYFILIIKFRDQRKHCKCPCTCKGGVPPNSDQSNERPNVQTTQMVYRAEVETKNNRKTRRNAGRTPKTRRNTIKDHYPVIRNDDIASKLFPRHGLNISTSNDKRSMQLSTSEISNIVPPMFRKQNKGRSPVETELDLR